MGLYASRLHKPVAMLQGFVFMGVVLSHTRSALLRAVDLFEKHTAPVADLLPTSIIHGDANEHNVLVNDTPPHDSIVGLLDVGDCHHGWRVAEVGIAAVYQAGMAVAHSGVQEDGGREEEDVLLRVGMQAAGDVLVWVGVYMGMCPLVLWSMHQ